MCKHYTTHPHKIPAKAGSPLRALISTRLPAYVVLLYGNNFLDNIVDTGWEIIDPPPPFRCIIEEIPPPGSIPPHTRVTCETGDTKKMKKTQPDYTRTNSAALPLALLDLASLSWCSEAREKSFFGGCKVVRDEARAKSGARRGRNLTTSGRQF